MASETSHDPIDGYDRVAAQFLDVAADPHENFDFGIARSPRDTELDEPPEANGRT